VQYTVHPLNQLSALHSELGWTNHAVNNAQIQVLSKTDLAECGL